jgi:hypothetical protein
VADELEDPCDDVDDESGLPHGVAVKPGAGRHLEKIKITFPFETLFFVLQLGSFNKG